MMEFVGKPSHREWRKIAKKERRRRLRRRAALEREADEARLRAALQASPGYLNWREQSEQLEREREEREAREHKEREKLWLEEEVRAQKEWQVLQEKKQKARLIQLEQEQKIREEFEAKQETIRKKQEEEKRKREEDMKKREQLFKEIDDYIDTGIKTPEALREVIDSQPGKELCPFFTKTGACRYGDTCSRNHRRVCLSRVILVPGFYTHFSLEKNSAEYDTDVALEYESSEMRQHFREFYNDVVPELESFGRIKTLKYCCNTEVHLRGNLYVEYYTEREAARAVRGLKGRWYAGRQLNCEFANLKSWRSAVCGMAKCPKGKACNFLHTFKNPHDEYDIKSPPRWPKQSGQDSVSSRRSEHRSKSKWEETVNSDADESRNWRWSESPETELDHRSKTAEKRRHRSTDKSHYRKSTHDKKQSDKLRTSEKENSIRRHGSRKYMDERMKDRDKDNTPNGRESTRGHSSRSRRSKENEPSYEDSKYKSYSNDDYGKTRHSKSQRYSERRSRRKSSDHEDTKHRSRSRSELHDDSSRKAERKDREKQRTKEARAKSKLDKEESEDSTSDSSDSSNSTASSETEEEPVSTRKEQRSPPEKLDNDWVTTDSESDETSRNVKH